jgi:hypothetical protein
VINKKDRFGGMGFIPIPIWNRVDFVGAGIKSHPFGDK